ncbi:hypothetical protein QK908_01195 [Lactococcus cremoris]
MIGNFLRASDLLWYLATSARYLVISLEQVASENIEKLESRLNRGKISGSGEKDENINCSRLA